MSVQTKTMFPVIIFLSLFLHMRDGADAFHVDKPMIYINFFDEVVSDNASSKFTDEILHTTPSPSNVNSVNNTQRPDSPSGLLKRSNENKTSALGPFDTIFEFDNPSETEITDLSSNESVDPSTTSRFNDLGDTDFLEPEITRMFFLRAITNIIEHIMEALFSIDDAPKLIDPAGFDYDLPTSRKLKKRDANEPTVEYKTESKTDTPKNALTTADVKHETKNSESSVSPSVELTKMHENLTENLTEHNSKTPSTTLVTNHTPSHGTDQDSTVKSHTNTEENEHKPTKVVKSHHDGEVLPIGKITHKGKFIAHKYPSFANDESAVLNDEVVNNKDNHFYEGVHPAEDHDGYKLDDRFTDEEEEFNNYKDSSSLVTMLLIAMTVLILLILVGVGLGAAYLFYRNQSQSGNQANPRTAVA